MHCGSGQIYLGKMEKKILILVVNTENKKSEQRN